MVKNLKVFSEENNLKRKLMLITTSIVVGISLTACSANLTDDNKNNIEYEPLDRTKIEFNLDLEDLKDYYDLNVDDIVDEMSEKEKEDYYVDVNVQCVGGENYPRDYIYFIRSDQLLVDDLKVNSEDATHAQLYPGLYEVRTSSLGLVGELEVLAPSKEVDLTVNLNDKTVSYTQKDKDNSKDINTNSENKKSYR